jgi:hypothetical protein
MYPQVVQLDTRRREIERELQLIRERRRAREGLEGAAGSTGFRSLRLRTLLRSAGWSRSAARSQS